MWKRENAIYFFLYWIITSLLLRFTNIYDLDDPTKIGILTNATGTISVIIGIILIFKKPKDKDKKPK